RPWAAIVGCYEDRDVICLTRCVVNTLHFAMKAESGVLKNGRFSWTSLVTTLGLWQVYWITSSARSNREGGIVIPSGRAVLRLRTSSNFMGCWTGSSPGLAPFKILSR